MQTPRFFCATYNRGMAQDIMIFDRVELTIRIQLAAPYHANIQKSIQYKKNGAQTSRHPAVSILKKRSVFFCSIDHVASVFSSEIFMSEKKVFRSLFFLSRKSRPYSRDSSRFTRRRPFIYAVNRYRVRPDVIMSRNCVPMGFTAGRPPAQGQ